MCAHDNQPALTIVKVFIKGGIVRTLPFRTPVDAGCNTCVDHPEMRFLGWLGRMNAAQPGFLTMIRSIYMRVYDQPCDVCYDELIRRLGKYQLANRLRYVATPVLRPGCSCGCNANHMSANNGASVLDTIFPDDPFGTTLFEQVFETKLSPNGKATERSRARQQADDRGIKRGKHRHVDHGIPLAQAHLDPSTKDTPNRRNLRVVTQRVHREKERMWNAYVFRTFFQRCSTPEERRRKLTEIYTELRKKYPNDTITHAFGKEMELLEISLP